mgnify:CR=1 FL=1
MYVTIEEIKQHLYIDFEADDILLADMIQAAEEIIEKYLNTDYTTLLNEDGTLPFPIKQAIKIMVR